MKELYIIFQTRVPSFWKLQVLKAKRRENSVTQIQVKRMARSINLNTQRGASPSKR